MQQLAARLQAIQGRPLYLTVDLDWFDPSVMPGTGTPEPGGYLWPDFAELTDLLQGQNLVAADVVELAPGLDASGCSSILAAKVVRSLLLSLDGLNGRHSDDISESLRAQTLGLKDCRQRLVPGSRGLAVVRGKDRPGAPLSSLARAALPLRPPRRAKNVFPDSLGITLGFRGARPRPAPLRRTPR